MEGLIEKIENRTSEVFENCGQKIFSILHRPEGIELAPLLVIIHGFSSNKIGTNRSWVSLAEACTKQGIAAIRFDLRGSGDSEGQFEDFSLKDMLSDIVLVIKMVREYPGIDPTRIALFGSSLGGALAVLAASQLDFIKALVLWAPVASGALWVADWMKANPTALPTQLQESLKTYRGSTLGKDFQQQFLALDAAKVLSRLDLPFLHLHGEKDDIVTMQHQKAFQVATEHVLGEFVTFPDLGHRVGFEQFMPKVFTKILSWLQDRV